MIFDISTGHLGDVLMAMPAMRAGDGVITAPKNHIPGLRVEWLEQGRGITAKRDPGLHLTDGWLKSAERAPTRHRLLPPRKRRLAIIAPEVEDVSRQWHGWGLLRKSLPDAVIVGSHSPRLSWMNLMQEAHTVICPNTGTAHMADALGVPKVIALYTSGHRDHLPYWDRSRCIVRDTMGEISLDDVLGAMRG